LGLAVRPGESPAGILLIVSADGGFKQTLIDTQIGGLIASWVQGSGVGLGFVLLLSLVV